MTLATSAVVMVSIVAGVPAPVVVLTAVDIAGVPKVSVVTDIPTAVDVLTAASVSPTFLAVRAVVGLLAAFGCPAVVASLLLLPPCCCCLPAVVASLLL
jgi:hypothetical protein